MASRAPCMLLRQAAGARRAPLRRGAVALFVSRFAPSRALGAQPAVLAAARRYASAAKRDATHMLRGADGNAAAERRPIDDFTLTKGTRESLRRRGIEELYPIQTATFTHVNDGLDVVGRARTGTGKTLAFALPVIERILRQPRADPNSPYAVVMLPTRELAKQVCDEISSVSSGGVTAQAFYGGTPYDQQMRALERGVDVVVGTPGRLLDHIKTKQTIRLSRVSTLVLDEADRMLDMGFQQDVEDVINGIKQHNDGRHEHQTLLFSATIPRWVHQLISRHLKQDHVIVDLIGDEGSQTATGIRHVAMNCRHFNKGPVLAELIKQFTDINEVNRHPKSKVLIFCERKAECNMLGFDPALRALGGIPGVLHGDIQQGRRERTMGMFKQGTCPIVIATDVAARGIDVPDIDLVLMTQVPDNTEKYVHRSGRTARAEKKGLCITLVGPGDERLLHQLEQHIHQGIELQDLPPAAEEAGRNAPPPAAPTYGGDAYAGRSSHGRSRGFGGGGGGYGGGSRSYGRTESWS
eukprot:TRINITY_DN1967_c0_g1_i2.p1 TRINITY_DN1967_c0_g1~~TRINITY_DN1967_c0_g1_i2.p1  ORF type:complete len:553 (+),score=180.07 TRINITY_DN1967_c0_g1_i2:90-1661(+)